MFAPKQYLYQNEALRTQSPKIISYGWCKKGTNLNWASKYPHSCIAIRGRQCKFPKFRGFLSPWYRVCTKAIFSSNGRFRDAEPKNFILGLVQIGYKPLRGFKVPAFMCRDIGPRMQVYEISGLPIAMVPCLHHNNIYIHRDAELKNIIIGLVQIGYKPLGASNYSHSCVAIQLRQCKFPIVRGFLSPWFRVCTEAILISKGSFRDAEHKNIIFGLVQ